MSKDKLEIKRFKWMTLDEALAHEEEAKKLRVSEVARSNRGFMRAYERAGGNPNIMARILVSGINRISYWDKRRNEFIARHMAQYTKPGGKTRRRWLSLAMWGYKPPGRKPKL